MLINTLTPPSSGVFYLMYIYWYMKIIITESQYNKFINLQRRLNDIIGEVPIMLDIDNDFWGSNENYDFCYYYPTLKKFMKGIVEEICHQWSYNFENIVEFIYDGIGYKNFIDMLMDEHGEEIINFHNEKTKDC